ncbi:sporulation phosphorelay system protein KapB [Alkalicoccus luteus]|uniref:Kinase n=1 Tax=Alkalicoccus luteus TaxID=1237094 RepID=A0A969PLG9_9BACI|nr:sporulation phosphorelay system protein KapB [Alkalicoccus luteus]NJP36386.1 kinase [Alkalicoccus luteus]
METGELVTCTYKTGRYIGRLVDPTPAKTTSVVQILAVLRHPVQGDLHQPGKTEVALFQERKALAFNEKANIPDTHLKPYSGDLPNYNESLIHAVHLFEESLVNENSPFADASLETLRSLKQDYRLKP